MILGYKENVKGFYGDDFKLALIIPGFAYYANYEESDENANTIIYNSDHELVSDNYFANCDLMETLKKINAGEITPEYISEEMQENFELLQQDGYFEK